MASELEGRVEALLLLPKDREEEPQELDAVEVTLEGFAGDKYYGATMKAGSSQKPYPKGAEVRNTRQISIVSREELAQVAEAMELPGLQAAWLRANLLVSGIPQLSKLPPGTRLHFERGPGLVVEEENMPCTTAGGIIQAQFPQREGLTQAFPKYALGKRGLVGWVERGGEIRTGDRVLVKIAELQAYPG